MSFRLHLAVCFVAGTALLAAGSAQSSSAPLTLQDAVRIALEKNPLRKAALADTRAASADIKTARSFLLPHLAFSETAMRGDDLGNHLGEAAAASNDYAAEPFTGGARSKLAIGDTCSSQR